MHFKKVYVIRKILAKFYFALFRKLLTLPSKHSRSYYRPMTKPPLIKNIKHKLTFS